jgi:hypothetical protein
MKHLTPEELMDLSTKAARAAVDQIPEDVGGCCTDTVVVGVAAALMSAVIQRSGSPVGVMRIFVDMLNNAQGRSIADVAVIHDRPEEPLPTAKAN